MTSNGEAVASVLNFYFRKEVFTLLRRRDQCGAQARRQ